MDRLLTHKILEWKEKPIRKPLIINGARQVGKTWLLKEVGQKHFEKMAYINLESSQVMRSVFKEGFDWARILNAIQLETTVMPVAGKTLIVFDEIQEVPEALTALKYFYENAPEYHVACAGSLLGIAIGTKTSFPVGKVEFLHLYPFSFMEFLNAVGETKLKEIIEKRDWSMVNAFHVRIKDYLRQYYYVGGMPEAVSAFLTDGNFGTVRQVQKNILSTYQFDFAKHAPAAIVPRMNMLWQSIPSQLAKENKKFIYKAIKEGARAKDYELAIHWLIDAGLVLKVNNLSALKLPLKAYEAIDSFKLFVLDVGILGALVDLDATQIISQTNRFTEFKGSLTEQYVLQQLKAQDKHGIYYWSQSGLQSEIDFVVDYQSTIALIEVKSEENLHSKSLRVMSLKNPNTKALRLSMSDYRDQDWMTNIPLCAAGQIYGVIESNRNSKS